MNAKIRIKREVLDQIKNLVFSRYPRKEWATFFRFGFKKCIDTSGNEVLVITIVDLIPPLQGDLNPDVGCVEFQSDYSLRVALESEKTPLCVGVIHSHPRNCRPMASSIDDDMDEYYRIYFADFTKRACYCSLIFSIKDGKFLFSGRGFLDNDEFNVSDIISIDENEIFKYGEQEKIHEDKFNKRIEDVYGKDARERLHNSSVAIIGCGGSGSAVAHILARAGVKKFVLVDFDRFDDVNLEKLHGSMSVHSGQTPKSHKVKIVKEHITSINPESKIIAIAGNVLQQFVKDYVIACDLVISCTDSIHSRVATSEISYRYLLPVIDVGVQLDSREPEIVTAEILQLTKYKPGLPCIYCRGLVDQWQLNVELMSNEEKDKRKVEARQAIKRGSRADSYWKDIPVLHTVGHLTTLGGSLASSYAIGWLTGKIRMPANFFQINIVEDEFGYVPVHMERRLECPCFMIEGYADQGADYTTISDPNHWPAAILI